MVKLIAETVCFKRPNSDKLEEGVMIGFPGDRYVIIDSDLNIVISCSLEHYHNNQQTFNLNNQFES